MAVMTDQQRFDVWADLMRQASASAQNVALTKTDLRAAINATDQWISDNAAVYNAALPAAAQTGLTPAQKALMFAVVALKRYGG